MCTCHERRPIFCILPPHILDSVAKNGTPGQRQDALKTMAVDQTIRVVRASIAMGLTGPAARRRGALPTAAPSAQRTIRDGQNGTRLPGPVVRRTEGQGPTGDPAVDEAYDGLGDTFDLYWNEYRRNSIDDAGLPLDATVHYDQSYDNAFWDGQQMVFGDGDGQLFNRFTVSIDVIGHELTHGVTEAETGLAYFGESGALNEHISDAFGSLVKQHALNQTADQADWLIGAGLLTSNVNGVALRSMKAPGTAYDDPVLGKDPQPDHMKNFVHTNQDNGGVHINSGIPNKAFYLAAAAIGGNAWEKTGLIWYSALLDPLVVQNTGFRKFARATLRVADRLYGANSPERTAVRTAWRQVGIRIQ